MPDVLETYLERVRAFHPNARLYLLSAILNGAALGVYRLLFNFYVLSLGMDESILGTLITIGSLTALIGALPLGYLADIIGRRSHILLCLVIVTVGLVMAGLAKGVLEMAAVRCDLKAARGG